MYRKKIIGTAGENIAAKYLEQENYKILERNFSCNQGELDIIAYDIRQNELVFIEVKTRSNFNFGYPSESVGMSKKRHIKKCIDYYVYLKNLYNYYIRIDVIEVVICGNKYKLNHLKNAF